MPVSEASAPLGCPFCGYRPDCGFAQLYRDALPLGSVVGELQLGRAVSTDRNSITYIGIDSRGRRILVREHFPRGYVRRAADGRVMAEDPFYVPVIEQSGLEFLRSAHRRQIVAENGTVYSYRRLRRKLPQLEIDGGECSAGLRSIIGSRKNQEDSAEFRGFTEGFFAVLCDGMGGISGGEIASSECVRIMFEEADNLRYCDEGVLPAVLRRLVQKANSCVSSLKAADERKLGCGTTLICAVVRENRLYFASVGDSRIYLIRDGSICQLTEEHNYLAVLLQRAENGEISYEDALSEPRREALTSYIGGLTKLQISSAPTALSEGDCVLLCSDGLYRALSDGDILRILSDSSSWFSPSALPSALSGAAVEGSCADSAAAALIRAVEERALPKQDNATLILYRHTERKVT